MRLLIWILVIGLSSCTIEREGSQDVADASTTDTSYQVDGVTVPDSFRSSSGPRDSTGRPRSTAGSTSAGAKLRPIDEAIQDEDFFAYRMRLIEAVGARDTSALFQAMNDDIRISFGTSNGKSGFREMWRPERPNSEVWTHLARVLGGGGELEQSSFPVADGRTADARFAAPYYYSAFPGREFDTFQHGVILGEDVAVREEPRSDARVIDRLSFDIVSIPNYTPYEDEPHDWVRVQLGEERFGYVPAPLVGNPVGYRAVFLRVDGEWTMNAFVAGD